MNWHLITGYFLLILGMLIGGTIMFVIWFTKYDKERKLRQYYQKHWLESLQQPDLPIDPYNRE